MTTTVIFLVVLIILVFGVAYFYSRGKKRVKKFVEKQAKAKPAPVTKPVAKPNSNGQTPAKTQATHRLIICPECITASEVENPEDSMPEASSVMVFTNWIHYAAHILQSHQTSPRVDWVIMSVKDEITRLNKEGKELPQSILTLVELIQSHGKSPVLQVGTPYSQEPELQEEDESEEPTEGTPKTINVIDNWAEKLGDIETLGKDGQDTEPVVVKPASSQKLKHIQELTDEMNSLMDEK